MDDKWRIRQVEAGDCADIEALAQVAYDKYVERMDRKPHPMLDDYAAHIAQGRAFALEDADGIAGFAVLLVNEEGAIWLETVAVKPDKQGLGYGRALVEFAEARARQMGFEQINLYTNVAMHENLTLYPHLGYVETRRAVQSGYKRAFFVKNLR